MTEERRGAMIQAIVPSFIIPFMDTSGTFKSFLDSDASDQVTARELREVDKLMVHKITGPAGLFAITVDQRTYQASSGTTTRRLTPPPIKTVAS